MPKGLYYTILIVLLLISSVSLKSQIIEQNTFKLTTDNGLSQNSIHSIFQDSKGFFWISTADGLNKYDGYNLTIFKNIFQDKNSISYNANANLAEDNEHKIWITHNNGISIYQPHSNTFYNINYIRKNQSTLNQSPILGNDKHGNMWIWMAEFGLKCFDKKGMEINFKGKSSIEKKYKDFVFHTGFIANNNLYVAGDSGLFILELNTSDFYIRTFHTPLFSHYKIDANKYIFGGTNYLYLYDIKTKAIATYKLPLGLSSVNFIKQVDNHNYLFGSKYDIHLYLFNSNSKAIIPQNVYNYSNAEKHIECIWIDKSKNLWIGSNFNGILKYNFPLKKISSLRNTSNFNLVKAIAKDVNGYLYVSNYDYGIDIYNPKMVKIKTLSNIKTTLALANFNQNYLIGYDLGMDGVILINNETFEVKKYSNQKIWTSKTTSFPQFSQDNNYFYYVYDNSIYKLRKLDNAKPVFICKINSERTGTISVSHLGEIIIGGNGYLEIHNNKSINNKIIKINNNASVKCIYEKDSLYYYIGTTNGLFVYDLKWKLLHHFNSTNGLGNGFIYGILEDQQNNIWLSTNNGIYKFYPEQKSFFHLSKSDGLLSSEFNSGAFFKDQNNTLYFGGTNGVNYFNASQIIENKTAAQGMITQFLVNDKNHLISNNLVLKPDENTISFEFAANEFTNTTLNEFKYLLVGVDKEWVASKNKHFARYTNLPHGKYIFKLKCSNNEGYYGNQILEFPFIILAPYYKTWWFRVLISALILLSIVGIFYLIYKRKLAKQEQQRAIEQQLQNQRIRFSRDLHDNIGSRTSLLIKNLETLKNDKSLEEINRLQSNASDILQNLRETVWAMNEGNISIESLADKITQFAQNRLPNESSLKLEITQDIYEDRPLTAEDFLNIYRICQESINNSVKYSNAKVLKLNFVFSLTNTLKIIIKDNGDGFELNYNSSNQYGIQNMKNRAEESQIHLKIDGRNGTRICLEKQF